VRPWSYSLAAWMITSGTGGAVPMVILDATTTSSGRSPWGPAGPRSLVKLDLLVLDELGSAAQLRSWANRLGERRRLLRFGSARRNGFSLGLCGAAGHLSSCARRSDDTHGTSLDAMPCRH
jgi:hypothetical protein